MFVAIGSLQHSRPKLQGRGWANIQCFGLHIPSDTYNRIEYYLSTTMIAPFNIRYHHRLLSEIKRGRITSVKLQWYPGRTSTSTSTKIAVKPGLDLVWQDMARRRLWYLQYCYKRWLGFDCHPGYYAVDVHVRSDLNSVSHAEWAEKTAEERAERRAGRLKNHNMNFLRCIDL